MSRNTGPRRLVLACALLAALAGCGGTGFAGNPGDGGAPGPAGGAGSAAQGRATGPAGRYVALGDSYAAGPGVPTLTGNPLGCGRSSGNYPSQVQAVAHYAQFHDVTCSGATTAQMSRTQTTRAGSNPPQLNALTPDTTLVTLTVGGNDIGFSDIVARCLSTASGGGAPGRTSSGDTGSAPCRTYYTGGGRDVLAARIAGKAADVTAVVARIRQRAPGAALLIVGYPSVLPTRTGCAEAALSAGDLAYVDQVTRALNSMLRGVADRSGGMYVDTATSSLGHDICAPPGVRWIEGPHPVSPAAPYHPNALGMRNSANQVLRALHLIP
jgi:lysophospholipase L1-like esterase